MGRQAQVGSTHGVLEVGFRLAFHHIPKPRTNVKTTICQTGHRPRKQGLRRRRAKSWPIGLAHFIEHQTARWQRFELAGSGQIGLDDG